MGRSNRSEKLLLRRTCREIGDRLLISFVSRRQLVGLEPGDDIHVRLRRGRHIYVYESDAMEPAAVWQIRGFDRYDDQLNRFKVATQR